MNDPDLDWLPFRGTLTRLLLLILVWLALTLGGCTLIFQWAEPQPPAGQDRPLRTRPPAPTP